MSTEPSPPSRARERALAAAAGFGAPASHAEIADLVDRLWPLPRSITGDGVRATHRVLGERAPLRTIEVPSGTTCFDWTVPPEWVCRGAHVIDPHGRRRFDVAENNLHLVGYSTPFRGRISRAELDLHLHSRPELPDAVPYVTSYYAPRWGFCVPHVERLDLPEGEYEVVVDTELVDGSMTLSDCVVGGTLDTEVLFSSYTCHPSMGNNELSGPLVLALACERLSATGGTRHSYRFAWLAETIGTLAYLAEHGERLRSNLVAGYVVTCIGDQAPFTFKRSRRRDTLADRAAAHCLHHLHGTFTTLEFDPGDGSDERQYCSPGFDLPVGGLSRSIYGSYPEYHTSRDDRSLIPPEALAESVETVLAIISVIEANRTYRRTMPFGEPQLGRRGLYPTLGLDSIEHDVKATMWVLNLSDGEHDLLAIAERSGYDIWLLDRMAQRCAEEGLLVADD
jgi:aminopeptidase-like protein